MVCRAGEITVSHHFSQLGVHQYAVAAQNGNLRQFLPPSDYNVIWIGRCRGRRPRRPVKKRTNCGLSGTPAPTAEPLSDIVGNAFMHSAKKSHNGTDKSVPYGRALPLIQGLTKLFDLCRKGERVYTGVCKFAFSVQGG